MSKNQKQICDACDTEHDAGQPCPMCNNPIADAYAKMMKAGAFTLKAAAKAVKGPFVLVNGHHRLRAFANETGLEDDLLYQAYEDFTKQDKSFALWWAENQGRYI